MSQNEPPQEPSWSPPAGLPSGSPPQNPIPPGPQYQYPQPQYPQPEYSQPAQSYDPYGNPLPQPPAERKRRRWPWVLAAIVAFLLIGMGSCTYFLFRAAGPSIAGANDWLAIVDEQRWDDAYDAMCPEVKAAVTREAAEAALIADFGQGLDGYRLSGFNNSNGDVSVGGEVTIGGRDRPITLAMEDGSGQWRVCGYAFVELEFGVD